MKVKYRNQNTLILFLVILAGLMLLTVPSFARANSSTNNLQDVWQKAQSQGSYEYHANVLQTIHPGPTLANVGRRAETQLFTVSGDMNSAEEQMLLKLKSGNQPEMSIKFAEGVAYGRIGEQDTWQKLENGFDIFAPGGDPLAYLSASTNVSVVDLANATLIESDMYPEEMVAGTAVYTFDIDGEAYAVYMRDQLEAQLRREGSLPQGIELDTAQLYRDMTGYGELLVNADGLPIRNVIQLAFPPQEGQSDRVEAEIMADFRSWNAQAPTVISQIINNPTTFLTNPADVLTLSDKALQTLQTTMINLSILMLIFAVGLFIARHRHSRKLQPAIATFIIVSMLAAPALQSHQTALFAHEQQTAHAEFLAQQAEEEAKETAVAEINGQNFNPSVNPLTANKPVDVAMETAVIPQAAPQIAALQIDDTACANPVENDHDCDGNADDDGDGLTDRIEFEKLGTDWEDADSDGDFISDKAEALGFTQNGKTWYLNPVDFDSNRDGLSDGIECPNLVDVLQDGTMDTPYGSASCPDLDGDGAPDIFDHDNDGDGVPDHIDTAPNYVGSLTSQAQSELQLDLGNLSEAADGPKTVVATFEIRPTEYKSLFQAYNVYDWPDDDITGQHTRVNNNTFADEGVTHAKASYGDMMLVPMMELVIPAPSQNGDNPSGGLPVIADYNTNNITDSNLDEWLDTTFLDQYQIEVVQSQKTGELVVYLPLHQLLDPHGNAPVAWSTQMPYRAVTQNWGNNHSYKMVWLIQALQDKCNTDGMGEDDTYDAWCAADSGNWETTKTVIHTYYEDFHITGLTVREEHGLELAVVAQNDALNHDYENDIWHLGNGLVNTFGAGELNNDGSRYDLDDVQAQFGAGNGTEWGIDVSNLNVSYTTYPDQNSGLAAMVDTIVPTMLADTYGTSNVNRAVSLLIAREEQFKTATLSELSGSDISQSTDPDTGAVTTVVNIEPGQEQIETYTAVQLAPYQLDAGTWEAHDIYTYLEELETNLGNSFSDSDINQLLGWFGESSDYVEVIRLGAAALGRNIYMGFYLGSNALVEQSIDGPLNTATINPNDQQTDFDGDNIKDDAALYLIAHTVGFMQQFFIREGDLLVDETVEILIAVGSMELSTNQVVGSIPGAGKGAIGMLKKLASKMYKVNKSLDYYSGRTYVNAVITGGGIVVGILSGLQSAGYIPNDGVTGQALAITFTSLGIVTAAVTLFDKLKTVYNLSKLKAAATTLTSAMKALKTTQNFAKANKAAAIIGLGISVGVATAVFILTVKNEAAGSLQFNAALAQFIAQIIVAVIMFVISTVLAASGIGIAVLATLAFLDALMVGICEIIKATDDDAIEEGGDVDKFVCGGITGAVTQAIVLLIYDQAVLADFEDKNRLQFVFEPFDLDRGPSSRQDGIMVGNTVRIIASITNTLRFGDPEGIGSSADYAFDGDFYTTENLKDVAFTYTWQENQTDQHDSLEQGTVSWTSVGSENNPKEEAVFNVADTYTFMQAGINKNPGGNKVVLTEAFNTPVLECWGFVVQDCEERSLKDSYHYDFSSDFKFDIFPQTFSEFITFATEDNRNVRLAWDRRFPNLADADGDGLISREFQGADPNDGLPDTDFDGITDYNEFLLGTDAEAADSDTDGLSDYWELIYFTNPNNPDTDNDGLLDGDDVYHPDYVYPYDNGLTASGNDWNGGWRIILGTDTNGTTLETWTFPSPLDADIDGDFIPDAREFIYGYNPNVAEEVNILSLDTNLLPTNGQIGQVAGGDEVPFNVNVTNNLSNRAFSGLLQSEFPVDVVQSTQVIDTIYPSKSTELTGTVTAPLGASSAMTLTTRAGAAISSVDISEIFRLFFNEADGATTFEDATTNEYDFTCATANTCPTLSHGTAVFDGNDKLNARAYNSDTDVMKLSNFTIVARIMPTGDGNGTQTFYDDEFDFSIAYKPESDSIELDYDGHVILSSANNKNAVIPGEWNDIAIIFEGDDVTLIINSRKLVETQLPDSPFTHENSAVSIGDKFKGAIDTIAFYKEARPESEFLTNDNPLKIYATLDEATGNFNENNYCTSYLASVPAGARLDCGSASTNSTNNKAPKSAAAQFLQGAHFTDSNEKITLDFSAVPNETLLLANESNAFSVSMILNRHSDTENGRILHMESANIDKAFDIWVGTNMYETVTRPDGTDKFLEPDDYTELVVELGTCANQDVLVPNNPKRLQFPGYSVKNEWAHLTVTYDGIGHVIIYKDGVFVGEDTNCGSFDFQEVDVLQLGDYPQFYKTEVGPDGPDYSETFDGIMDDVRLYGEELSADEVLALYQSSAAKLLLEFDEAPAQNSFADASENSYEISCRTGYACPDSGIPGRSNRAIRFDGSPAALALPSAQELSLTNNNFRVSAWVKLNSVAGNQTVLGTDDPNGLSLRIDNGNPAFYAGSTATWSSLLTLEANKWYEVVWSYTNYESNGDANNPFTGGVDVYVNGSSDTLRLSQVTVDTEDDLFLGQSGGGNYFNGLIDNLVIVSGISPDTSTFLTEPALNLHLDEDTLDNDVVDDSPYSNNMTCSNCPEVGAKGQIREAAIFDGDDVLQSTSIDEDELDATHFTISTWIRPFREKGTDQIIFERVNANGTPAYNYRAWINPNSMQPRFKIHKCGGQNRNLTSSSSLLENQWNHVVFTYDRQQMKIYINGTLDSSKDSTIAACTDEATIKIGEGFEGGLDELAFYPSALDAAAVRALFDYQNAWYDTTVAHAITVDNDKPQTSLELYSYVPNEISYLTIKASDNTTYVDAVDVTITAPSGATSTATTTQDEKAWILTFEPTEGAGDYTVNMVATDGVGNQSDPVSAIVSVDAQQPTLTFDSVTIDASYGTPVTLRGTATDDKSGIDSENLTVDIQDANGASLVGPIVATVDGDDWEVSIDQMTPPYGYYTATVSTVDTAGNLNVLTSPMILDGHGPVADITMDSRLITDTNTLIRGTVSDNLYPLSNRLLHLHFEEESGATTFLDGSTFAHVAQCSNCPTADQPGSDGRSLQFDGIDDGLTIAAQDYLELENGTLMAWVQPNWAPGSNGYDPVLLAMDDGSATGYRWQISDNRQSLILNNGSSSQSVALDLTDDNPHHVALAMDNGIWTAYLDGRPAGTITQTFGTQTGLPLHIGWNGTGEHFNGSLDEVVIYSSALPNETIYHIANPIDTAVSSVSLRYRHLNGSVWTGLDNDDLILYLPMNESANEKLFADISIRETNATCDFAAEQCPQSGVNSNFSPNDKEKAFPLGRSLLFDGVNDYLSLPNVIDPGTNDFTVGLYFRLDNFGANDQVILAQQDGSGAGQIWLGINTNGNIYSNLGGVVTEVDYTLQAGTVYWTVLVYTEGLLKLYVRNTEVPAPVETNVTISSNNGSFVIGTDPNLSNNFNGIIDEVVIFNRAFSHAEVVQHYKGFWDVYWHGELGDEAGGLATFSRQVFKGDKYGIEGPYQIDLQTKDAFGNIRLINNAWNGDIDTRSPLLSFGYEVSADRQMVTVTCQADDLNLVTSGWHCPSDLPPAQLDQSAAWYLESFPNDPKLGTLVISETLPIASGHYMEACDLYGHCRVATPPFTVLDVNVPVTQTPAHEVITVTTTHPGFDAANQVATWVWGDGTTSPAEFDAETGILTGSHTYAIGGQYSYYLEATLPDSSDVDFTIPQTIAVMSSAAPDEASTNEDTGTTIDVLANDNQGAGTTVLNVTQPSHGTVVNNSSDVTYTPEQDFYGTDSFTYDIDDGTGQIHTAVVTVNVTPVNDPPTTVDDTATAHTNQLITIDVLTNDSDVEGDALTLTAVTQPTNGTTAIDGNAATYISNQNFVGNDSFTYTVTDANGLSSTGIVNVTNDGTPILALSFEEALTETTFIDSSGFNNHATCINCPGRTYGADGRGLLLDGVDDRLTVPYFVNPGDGAFTVMTWFNVSDLSANRQFLAQKDVNGTGRTWLGVRTNNVIFTNLSGSRLEGGTVNEDQWYHGAVTYDGSTISLYLDGTLVGTQTRSANSSVGALVIGANKNEAGAWFPGGLDELKVYDRALSTDEILTHATQVTPNAPRVVGETGTVTLNNTIDQGVVVPVTLQHTYVDPVVVAYITSRNGTHPIQVRVKNLTNNSFDIFMREARDTNHNAEQVSYIVMESGHHVLEGGLEVDAQLTNYSGIEHVRGRDYFIGWWLDFAKPFGTTPAVLHTLVTDNNNDHAFSHIWGVDTNEILLETGISGTNSSIDTETVGWMAFTPGSGTTSGFAYEVGVGSDGSDDGPANTAHTINYNFTQPPVLVVSANSMNGYEGHWARSAGTHTATSATVFAEEDHIRGDDNHTDEVFGWAAFEPGTIFYLESGSTSVLTGSALGSFVNVALLVMTLVLVLGLALLAWKRPFRRRYQSK